MSYLGRSAKLSLKAQEKVSFLATAGQTVKTGLSYTPSFIEVYVNGVLLTDTTDFTATNGNSVTFTVALLLNDEVTVISLKTFTVADHYTKTEADTLLAAKATNTALALKAPIAAPVFTGNVGIGAGTALSPLDVKSGFITVSKDAATAGRIGASAYITGSTDNDLIVQATGSGVTKLYQSGVNSLNIDAAGIVTKPLQPAFDAYSNQNSYSCGTSITSTNINTTRFNTGNHYSTSGLRFVAPVAGVYRFNYRTIASGALSNAHIRMYKNGTILSGSDSHYSSATGTNWSVWTYSILVQLSVNDYVQVGHTSSETIHGDNYQSFNGYLIG